MIKVRSEDTLYKSSNSLETFDEEIIWTIIYIPTLEDRYLKLFLLFVLLLFCTICSAIFKENKYIAKIINNFTSRHVFHILLGIILAQIEGVMVSYGLVDAMNPIEISGVALGEIRMPILLYASYSMYHHYFFKQLPYILVYGIAAKVVFLVLTALTLKIAAYVILDYPFTYSQVVSFASLTAIVDPLTAFNVFKDTSQRNFYLLLGIYSMGNGITVEVYESAAKLASLPSEVAVYADTYVALSIKVVLDVILSILTGFIIGIIFMSFFRAYLSN